MRIIPLCTIVLAATFMVSCAHKNKDLNKDQTAATKVEEKTKVLPKKADLAKDTKSYVCDVKGDKRTINFDKKDKRCEVHYTKSGEKSQVAWAEAHPEICSDVYDKIRTNIEGGGFKCIDGSTAQKAENQETASR